MAKESALQPQFRKQSNYLPPILHRFEEDDKERKSDNDDGQFTSQHLILGWKRETAALVFITTWYFSLRKIYSERCIGTPYCTPYGG